MIKKILILLFINIACTPLDTDAQEWSALRQFITNSAKHTSNISRQTLSQSPAKVSKLLTKNIKTSYNRTRQLHHLRPTDIPHSYAYGITLPGYKLTGPLSVKFLKELYPDMSALITSDWQLANYFVSRNNREVAKAEKEAQRYLQNIRTQLYKLKDDQIRLSHPASQDLTWLSHIIPHDTDYLLLGEVHTYPVIQENIARLLPKIRQQFGEREIILFTEFLPEGQIISSGSQIPQDFSHPYNRIWQAAVQAQIPTVGLEPAFLDSMNEELIISMFKRQDMWGTMEGVRQRNRHWINTIHHFRQQHPDALFIIYAGNFHLSYIEPFSLGTYLASQRKTFLTSFIPGFHANNLPDRIREILKSEPWYKNKKNSLENNLTDFMPITRLDFATKASFGERVLYFGSQQNDLTGFDVQLKIEIPYR